MLVALPGQNLIRIDTVKTLSPETKVSLKTAFIVITALGSFAAGFYNWLDQKFETQKGLTERLTTNVAALRYEVGNAWSVNHMQVWTDMYNRTGAPPNPMSVVEFVNRYNRNDLPANGRP